MSPETTSSTGNITPFVTSSATPAQQTTRNPIAILPWYLEIASRISPMRYVVDLFRDVVYSGRPEYHRVVLLDPLTNLTVMAVMFGVFIVIGTTLFVRRETNR